MKRLFHAINKNSTRKNGTMLIGAMALSNFINLLFNAFLGRQLRLEEFALIALFGSILSISDIPLSSLGKTVTHVSAFLFGKNKLPSTDFWQQLRKKAFLVSLLIVISWAILSPAISNFFNVESALPVLVFSPVWLFLVMGALDGGFLTGSLKFGLIAIAMVAESSVKLLLALILFYFGFGSYIYLSIIVASFISFLIIFISASRIEKKIIPKSKVEFPIKFYFSNIMTKASTVAYLSMDVLFAKHYLSPQDAGLYALLALNGKMIFLASSLFAQFILPLVSLKEGAKENPNNTFVKLLIASTISSSVAFLTVGVLGQITVPIIFGEKALAITPFLLAYGLSMMAFSVSTSISTYNQVKGRHMIPVAGLCITVIQALLLMNFNSSLLEIVSVMSVMGVISLFAVTLMHFCVASKSKLNLKLGGNKQVSEESNRSGLRILILNWRDIKHSWAGGAEVYIQELAKRWVNEGNTVTIFCGNDGKSPSSEVIEGVSIIRKGGFVTVYFWALFYYLTHLRKKVDIVIDSENGIPFFSPLYSRKPVLLLIHHVHQEVFIEQLRSPISHLARIIEGKLMPYVYRGKFIITVSESTKKEIQRFGIARSEDITIINPGVNLPEKKAIKTSYPSIVYLGRLKPYKNIDVAIKAFARIKEKYINARLWIVGDGESMKFLKKVTTDLKLDKDVTFFGKVTDSRKSTLLSKSWIALQPSTVEGWGITVLEANACGTPVIASDTKGLRDSVVNNKTGFLVPVKNIDQLAARIDALLFDSKKRELFSKNAYKWAKKFSWEEKSMSFLSVLQVEAYSRRPSIATRFSYTLNKLTSMI